MKRKAVRMWAVWWNDDAMPVAVGWTRLAARKIKEHRYAAYVRQPSIVRVELRRVPAKRRKARKR